MRSHLNYLLSFLILLAIPACTSIRSPSTPIPTIPTVEQTNPKIFGVFEGITPCSHLTRPLPQIPEDTDCEQMIWKIILYQDPATGMPTTYELNSAYGLSQQNSNGLAGGGTEIVLTGNWDILEGTDTVIYQLNPDVPGDSVSFIKIGDDVLHVLSRDGALLVGHGAWSYTINRTDTHPYQPISNPGSAPEAKTPLVVPTMPVGSSLRGVFEGRTPCHEIVFKLTDISPYPRCIKIKLQLTLYQDEKDTGGTYVLRGTSTIRTGTWKVTQGTKIDADAVVYQLYSDDSQAPFSLLKVDDNHLFLLDEDTNLLVGNALFSYTLSRTK
jgi:hypothetical protein